MNDIIVHLIDLPPAVKGLVRPTRDGDYLIFINAVYNQEQQREIYNHEVRHLLCGHHYIEGRPMEELEREASDKNALLQKIEQAQAAGLPLAAPLTCAEQQPLGGHEAEDIANETPPEEGVRAHEREIPPLRPVQPPEKNCQAKLLLAEVEAELFRLMEK